MQQRNRLQKKKAVQHASQECLEEISRRVLEVLSGKQQSSITSILEALHTHSESFQNDLLAVAVLGQEISNGSGVAASISGVIISKEEASQMAIDLGENALNTFEELKKSMQSSNQLWTNPS